MSSSLGNRYKLFKIQCLDMLCLADMERNGIVFNTEKAMAHAKGIAERQLTLYSRLVSLEVRSRDLKRLAEAIKNYLK